MIKPMKINLGLHDVAKQIEQINRSTQRIANWATRWNELGRRIAEKHESIAGLLIHYGWPPPLHFPVSGLDELLPLFESGELVESDVASVFKRYYTSDVLDDILKSWQDRAWLEHRFALLNEGLSNYNNRRFSSCVAVVLPNIEGVLGDHFGRKPKPHSDFSSIFRSHGLDKSTQEFYQSVVLASFKWNEEPLPSLNRHQIMHGKDVSYGTQDNALKAILLFDAVQDALNDQKERKESPN